MICVLYATVSRSAGDGNPPHSGKSCISLITCHVHTPELSVGVVGGVASAVLAAILVIVLLSVCIVINCYKNRNQ